MTPGEFFAGIIPFVPFYVFKILIVVGLLLHVGFALVVVRQTKLMIAVVEARISPFIYAVAIFHLLFSALVLIWTILFI